MIFYRHKLRLLVFLTGVFSLLAPISSMAGASSFFSAPVTAEGVDSITIYHQEHEKLYRFDKKASLLPLYRANYLLKTINNEEKMAENHYLLGKYFWNFSQYDSAGFHFGHALRLYENLGNVHKQADILDIRGLFLYYRSQYDSALMLMESALEVLDEKESNEKLIGRILHHQGLVLLDAGRYTSSLEAFSKALVYLDNLSIPGVISDSQIKVSKFINKKFNFTGESEKSNSNIREKEKIIGGQGLITEKIDAILELIEIYSVMDSTQKVQNLGLSYLELTNSTNSDFLRGHSNFVMGTIAFDNGLYEKSVPYFQTAYSDFKEGRDTPINISVAAFKLATAYLKTQKYDSAMKYNLIPMSSNEKLNHITAWLKTVLLQAEIHFGKDEKQKALEVSHEGLKKAIDHSNHRMVPEFYNQLSLFYNQLEQVEDEYFYKLKFMSHQDSIFRFENGLSEIQLKTEYGLFIAEKEIASLDQQNRERELALEEEKQSTKQLVVIVLIVVAGLIMLLARFLHLRKVDKVKTLLLKETHHRLKNNLQMVVSVLNLSENSDDLINEIKGKIMAISTLHSLIYQDISIKEIDLKNYLSEILKNIADLYELSVQHYQMKGEVVFIGKEKALLIALVFNELVSNSIKHCWLKGFSDDYRLTASVVRLPNGKTEIKVKDNGSGWTENDKDRGTGLDLVKQILKSLKGELVCSHDSGTEFVVKI